LSANLPVEIKAPADVSPILSTITDKHGFTQSSDGTCLFYRYWNPAQETSPEFVVLMLHGIGLHSGAYASVAAQLNKPGIAFYAVDMRGHGLSCGKRGHVADAATETGDIGSMLATIRQLHPHAKLFLMAESMSTVFALNFAEGNSKELSGVILVSPYVAVDSDQWRQWGTFKYLPDLLFWPNKPAINLVGRGVAQGTEDAKSDAPPPDDPLTYYKVSVNYILEVHRATGHWADAAPHIQIPALILQGEDDAVVKPGSDRRLFNLLASKDKEFKVFPNAQHSLLRKPPTPDVLSGISDWIVRH
jgi:alpha-beta hydrolase superfamily lysophospholipase